MKVVQTLWTKPTHASDHYRDRFEGGWKDKRYHLMSWALSCLTCKRFYSEMELVTDQEGKRLLIDHLELPYTSVKTVLDGLNGYPANLWATGKLYAYSLQEAPFLHIDSDVYLWKRFGSKLESSPLVAQNLEVGHQYYKRVLAEMEKRFTLPIMLSAVAAAPERAQSINAGILGGQNTAFIRSYAQWALSLIDQYKEELSTLSPKDLGLSNTIFEQLLFYRMAKEEGVDIHFYFDAPDYSNYSYLTAWEGVPYKSWYIHLIGKENKQSIKQLSQLELRLRKEFPAYYYHIQRMLENHVL